VSLRPCTPTLDTTQPFPRSSALSLLLPSSSSPQSSLAATTPAEVMSIGQEGNCCVCGGLTKQRCSGCGSKLGFNLFLCSSSCQKLARTSVTLFLTLLTLSP
jgi:hypothetical protein